MSTFDEEEFVNCYYDLRRTFKTLYIVHSEFPPLEKIRMDWHCNEHQFILYSKRVCRFKYT